MRIQCRSAVRLYISASEMAAGSPEQVNVYALDMTDQRKLEALGYVQ